MNIFVGICVVNNSSDEKELETVVGLASQIYLNLTLCNRFYDIYTSNTSKSEPACRKCLESEKI